jgi:hypothetical protein
LGAEKPMCVSEVPNGRTLVIIQNNKILGVSTDATPYGGADRNGDRTDEASTDPEDERTTNTNTGPPPMGDNDSTGSDPQGTNNPPAGGGDTNQDEITTIRKEMGAEAGLPKIMDIINMKRILGIGKEKDQKEECLGHVGEERDIRNVQPGILYLAIPCPENCNDCMVSKYGSLVCTKAIDGKKVQHGKVVEACPTEGYFEIDNVCHKCPGGPGCKTCSMNTSNKLTCDACFDNLGYMLELETVDGRI